MRARAACLIFLSTFAAPAARAAELQIAVLFDSGLGSPVSQTWKGGRIRSWKLLPELPDRVRAELRAFESALRAERPSIEFAIITCDAERGLQHVDFDPSLRDVAARLDALVADPTEPHRRGCSPNADAIEHAIESLEWKKGDRRILIVSRFGQFGLAGRTTAEEAVHRAERAGIVVHAIEFFSVDFWTGPAGTAAALAAEIDEFLNRPTAPLGRVPRLTRHATLLSGGSYFVAQASTWNPVEEDQRVDRRTFGFAPLDEREYLAILNRRALTKPAYAEGARGKDGLDDLADGVRRPSEVAAVELPDRLHGIDLEPLLDAVWNYVDARRVIARLVRETAELVEDPGRPAGELGADLARAIQRPRRLPPSRR